MDPTTTPRPRPADDASSPATRPGHGPHGDRQPHDARPHDPQSHDARPHDPQSHDARPHDPQSHDPRPHDRQARDAHRDEPQQLDVPRTALVTGAGRGIGRGLAVGLARAGWSVALVGRTEATLLETAAEVERAGATAVVVPADVTVPAQVDAAARRVEEAFAPDGGLGLLVNNAGVIERQEVPFLDDDLDDLWRVVEVNVRGPILLTRALLPGMLARGGGRVVNINSGAAHRRSATYTGYGISKGALARLTTILDTQYRDHGLRVFDLAPGVVETDMTRSMPMWDGKSDWTPVERSVDLLVGIGSGRLDALAGRFLHAAADTVDTLLAHVDDVLTHDARRLRLVGHGPDDGAA